MDIQFHNTKSFPVVVVIASYRPDICTETVPGSSDTSWLLEGWKLIEPNGTITVLSTTSTTFYYYIESQDIEPPLIWSGSDKYAYVTDAIIDYCIATVPEGSRTIGMIMLNTGQLYDTYTVNVE